MNAINREVIKFLRHRGFLEGRASLGDQESLTGTGVIDSIGLLQLVDHLERTYKIEIPMDLITPDNFDTLEGISRTVTDLKK